MPTRRTFLTSAAAAGSLTILPFAARAAGHAADTFETPAGSIRVHPINHATFVMETPMGVIYNDPNGDPARLADFPDPDIILVTHEHGDHYNPDTLAALKARKDAPIITTPSVLSKMPAGMTATAIANGESTTVNGLPIDAIPAYNTSENKQNFHPKGRDNGYVLNFEGFRIYISGDTEETPEMGALESIDLAFICMNLPFTMSDEAAAMAVKSFGPKYVYPYHFRGRDISGTQDPEKFAELVGDTSEVRIANWYG